MFVSHLIYSWFLHFSLNPSQDIAEKLKNKDHMFILGKGLAEPIAMVNNLLFIYICVCVNKEHMFILGKGFGECIAREGALKIKEITYVHAEGYSGGALKHGPFAMIEDHKGRDGATPIILLILDDEHAHHMQTAAQEVRARGAYTIVITDKRKLAEGIADEIVEIPSNGPLTALLAVVPMQLLAYELAVAKGLNPDQPIYLAKTHATSL